MLRRTFSTASKNVLSSSRLFSNSRNFSNSRVMVNPYLAGPRIINGLNLLGEFKEYRNPLCQPDSPLFNIERSDSIAKENHHINGAILDWSGTTADAFVIAPAYAFVKTFEVHGVKISMQQARIPMGLRKDLHINALTEMPEIKEEWKRVHGRYPTDEDRKNLFKTFMPLQNACLSEFTDVLPGAVDGVNALKNLKIKTSNTTGFNKESVEILARDTQKQGLKLDEMVAGDEVSLPRPYPLMVYRAMTKLALSNLIRVIKVDDTVAGVGEGLSAGTWTIGVSDWSNYMDIDTMQQFKNLSEDELQQRRAKSRDILLRSGAHYVVPDISPGYILPIISDINARMKQGYFPRPVPVEKIFANMKEINNKSEKNESLSKGPRK